MANDERKIVCKSCSIPMTKTEDFGSEADGKVNYNYCHYCYVKGALKKM